MPGRNKRCCAALTRKRSLCEAKALRNGRCRLHGGTSTGPKTVAGKAVAAANLPHRRFKKGTPQGVGLGGGDGDASA